MSLQERDLEALAALFGDEEKARQWLESHVDNVEEAIKEAGMMARTVDDEPDADPEPETPEMVEFELDDGALDSIVERVISRLEDQFAQVMDKIVELQQQTTLLTDQAEKSRMLVDERLDALEADEEEKQKQWMADMPRNKKQRLLVTHRPSGNPTDPEEPTVAERAEVGLESWSVKERYPQ